VVTGLAQAPTHGQPLTFSLTPPGGSCPLTMSTAGESTMHHHIHSCVWRGSSVSEWHRLCCRTALINPTRRSLAALPLKVERYLRGNVSLLESYTGQQQAPNQLKGGANSSFAEAPRHKSARQQRGGRHPTH